MSYRSQFNIREPNFTDIKGAIAWLKEFMFQSKKEFKALESANIGTSAVSVISVASGGGGSSPANLYANQAIVSTSATPVSFPHAIVNPIILYRAVNSLNETIGCDLTGITSSGFTASATESGVLHFAVFPS